jgi:hypothetical protein
MNKISTFSTDEIFTRLFKSKSSSSYWNYIRELRKRKTNDIYQKAIQLTNSIDNHEKVIGINILAQFGYSKKKKSQILNIYFNLLKSESNIKIISSILYGIGHNNKNLTEKQIGLICCFHSSKSATIRYSLTFALSGIENKNAISTLIKLSKDKDADIRDWATFGIGSQIKTDNIEIRETLWERVTDTDKNTRDEAIAGLAIRKDQRVKEILKKELETANDLSSLMLEAIENFDDKEFINLIELKIHKNKTEHLINEDWLSATLTKLKNNKNETNQRS